VSEKILSDSESLSKEKEKSKALFNELVRLGEQSQKQQQTIDNS
jgi:hypothetical protein